MRTIYRDCVVGIIISKDNKLLMGMKDPHGGGVYADCWHLPGGGIEEGESQLDALKREMSEEVKLDINDATVRLIDNQGTGESEKRLKNTNEVVLCKMKFYVYKISLQINASKMDVSPGDDLQRISWFNLNGILKQNLTPPSREFFASKMHLL